MKFFDIFYLFERSYVEIPLHIHLYLCSVLHNFQFLKCYDKLTEVFVQEIPEKMSRSPNLR